MSAKTKQELITGAVIYALMAMLFVQTMQMPSDSALFPRMTIILLAVMNTVVVITSFRKSGGSAVTRQTVLKPLLYYAGIVVYAVLFLYTGYFIASTIMLAGFMIAFKVRPWWKIAVIAASYALFIYVLFIVWLKVSLI